MPAGFDFQRFRFALLYTIFLLLGAGLTTWYGTREGFARRSPAIAEETADVVPVGGPIELPIVDLDPPEQPHRDVFMVDCVICHTARLPLSQPDLSEKQWKEVVHKMVATYGAPISKEDEENIVTYLSAVQANRGRE